MSTVKVPLWINLLSVVAAVFIVYLLAKWDIWKTERDKQKGEVVPLKRKTHAEGPRLKKAA